MPCQAEVCDFLTLVAPALDNLRLDIVLGHDLAHKAFDVAISSITAGRSNILQLYESFSTAYITLTVAEMKLPTTTHVLILSIGCAFAQITPNYTSPLGVEVYNPSQSFNVSGPWSLMTKAGNMLYISGEHA